MEGGSGPGARILIVDDEERIATLVQWFLQRLGHDAAHVASFREARERLCTEPPELLLSDIELGEESAREELPRLHALGLLPPTLIVSGYLDPELVGELTRLPMVRGVLAKPFEFEVLAARIDELLAGPAEAAAPPSEADRQAAESSSCDQEDPDEDGWVEILPIAPLASEREAP